MSVIRERRGLIRSVVTAMATRPFMIMAGVSGSGKTQLARRLAAGVAAGGLEGGCYTRALMDVEGGLDRALARALVDSGVAPGAFDGGDPAGYIDISALGALDDGLIDQDERGRPRPGPARRSYEDVLANRVAFLAVRPDWKDTRQLWGSYNPLTGLFYPTRALRVVIHALLEFLHLGHRAGRHVLILDEMNLARVEYYLSDLLSLMESAAEVVDGDRRRLGEMIAVHPFRAPLWTEAAPIHPGESPGVAEQLFRGRMHRGWARAMACLQTRAANHTLDPIEVDFEEVIDGADWHRLVPSALCVPPNLTIIGTVNVDETTFALAPKVLDRAFVVEFEHMDYDEVCGGWPGYQEVQPELKRLYDILEPARLHFGYRVVGELLDYLQASGQGWALEGDFLLSSRVLPKLGGTEAQVGRALRDLLGYCLGLERGALEGAPDEALDGHLDGLLAHLGLAAAVHPRSARRLLQMVRELRYTGVTSFL